MIKALFILLGIVAVGVVALGLSQGKTPNFSLDNGRWGYLVLIGICVFALTQRKILIIVGKSAVVAVIAIAMVAAVASVGLALGVGR